MLSALQNIPGLDSPELEQLFADIPLATLESSSSVIYATDPAFRLMYVNPAWDAFAVDNGAPHLVRKRLGRVSAIEIAGALSRFYSELFDMAVTGGKPVEHRFLCPTPTRSREFQMRVLPLRSGGVLVSSTRLVERSHTDPESLPYTETNHLITMCSHCRRTKRPETDQWDWIPEYVTCQPEQVSHGLCSLCLEFHYLSLKRG